MDSIAKVFRIVALAEETLEEKEKLKLTGRSLTPEQQIKIDQLLRQFTEVLMTEPGYTSAAVHKLDTGEHPPYRLCLAWRQQAKAEIDSLLQGGIIEPCTDRGRHRLYLLKGQMVLFDYA